MADGLLRLLLVDADPIFRLGLKTGIDELTGATLVAVGDRPGALTVLSDQAASPDPPISVILVDAVTDGLTPTNVVYVPWSLCEELHQTYPHIPILVLGNGLSEIALIRAQRAGASGYCTKDSSVRRLVAIARQLQRGETIWPALPSLTPPPQPAVEGVAATTQGRSLRLGWNNQGLREIDQALAQLNAVLTQGTLANPKNWGDRIQRVVAEGRQRELRTARKLVIALGGGFSAQPPQRSPQPAPSPTAAPSSTRPSPSPPPIQPSPSPEAGSVIASTVPSPLASSTITEDTLTALQNSLFDRCTNKLINAKNNQTGAPLEIDILKVEQRKDLLYLVLRKVDDTLLQIRKQSKGQRDTSSSPLNLDPQIQRKLWEECLEDFFADHQTCKINQQTIEILPILKNDWPIIEQDILSQVIDLQNLTDHLILGTDLIADGGLYPPGHPIALERAEALLQNWILCLANAVIQPLINRLSDIEPLKYQFFDRRWMATRYVERFRNDLSWKYRLARYIETPTAIFESRHWLLTSDGRSIGKIPVYGARNEELRSLSGIPLGITLVLEARDAIAPRLRSAVAFFGQGTLLVLRAVGRGIGLVGRGVLQGIGSSWQDVRRGKKPEDS